MPVVQVEAHLSVDKLLEAVKQMSSPELEQFVSQVIALQAQRKAPGLSPAESELLIQVNKGLPSDAQTRLHQLISKRRAETLTSEEQSELVRLTDQLEALEAARVEALAQLARLRGVSLTTLLHDLGIRAPNYG